MQNREAIIEVAKKVAQLLTESQITFSDLGRVYREVEHHLGLTFLEDPAQSQ